jgi:hypothetical protein
MCRLWIKQLPCIKASLHRSDFVQQNVANYTPINSPFGYSGQKSLDWLEIHSRSKSKLLPFFVTKGQRVKQSKEKNHVKITPPKCLRMTRVNRVIISKSYNVLRNNPQKER